MKLYSIGKFGEAIGKTTQTLRNWNKSGELVPHFVSEKGTRYYSQAQLDAFNTLHCKTKKITIGYCRVSSAKQKDDLERQVQNTKDYMIARGYSFDVITDIGSGINYKKKGLKKLLDLVSTGTVERVVVLYKDRLIRFGYELIEDLCKRYNTEIEIIDNTEKTQEQELVEDMIQIVTVFSCKLQGRRANKAKKMIKELIDNDS